MPQTTIPLAVNFTQRGFAKTISATGKDSQIINGIFEIADSPQTGKKNVYVVKRCGCSASQIAANSLVRVLQHYDGGNSAIYADETHTKIYYGTTSVGTASVNIPSSVLASGLINGIMTYAWVDGSSVGWYLPINAISIKFPTFTGDTHTSTTVDNISGGNTTGLFVGEAVTGSGFQPGTRIAAVGATSITLTLATTTSLSSTTITKEAIAKVIDTNLPGATNAVYLDGYFFWGTQNGRIYNSGLNTPDVISSSYITVSQESSNLSQIVKYKGKIIAIGSPQPNASGSFNGQGTSGSWEWFYNAGDGSGSPLKRVLGQINYGPAIFGQVAYFEESMYFVSQQSLAAGSSLGRPGLWRLSGGELTCLSDDIIGGILAANDGILIGNSHIRNCGLMNMSGRTFIAMFQDNIGAGVLFALLYDIKSNQFYTHLLSNSGGSKLAINGVFSSTFTVSDDQGASGASSSSYTINGSLFQDNSIAYTLTAQTENKFLNGGKPFIVNYIDVICDTQASGSSTVSASGDDGASFDTIDTIDLTSQLKRVQPGGRYESSAMFRVTDAGNQPWRGQALIVDWEPCV